MNSRIRKACLIGLAAATGSVAGCSSRFSSPETSGTVALHLELAPGITLAALSFAITHPTLLPTPRNGVVDVSHSQAVQFVVGGLPASGGYTITLTGNTDGPSPLNCVGIANFGVAAETTSSVAVALVCSAGAVDGGQNGSIIVNGSATIVTSCAAALTSLSASPSEANVGSTMLLSGGGVDAHGDGSDVTLGWSLNDATVGSLSTASGGSTIFTCNAPGPETVTLTASVGGAAACPTQSAQSMTLLCDAVCGWGLSAALGPAVGAGPASVAIGDLNGDGKPDLAVANSNLGRLPGTVSVLLGHGDGTFQPQAAYASGGLGLSALAVGDLNGDGKLDLAVANTNSNDVSVLTGKGDGTFGPPVSYPTGSFPSSLAIADLNGDHVADLVVANFGSGAVGPDVFLGKGDGTFQLRTTYATDLGGANSVAIGDLNGDGKPDLAVATDSTNAVSVLLGKGDGTFDPFAAYAAGSVPWSVAIGDLNGDGKLDLAVANQGFAGPGNVSVLLGNGDGTFRTQVVYAAGSLPWFIAIGDLNGDGKADLAVANNGSNNVGVLLGNGDGTFQAQVPFATGSFPASIAIGDLNGDAKVDLAVANQSSSGNVSVFLGTCGP
jgi:VCBS repeat protein/FG-GAP repeat protein